MNDLPQAALAATERWALGPPQAAIPAPADRRHASKLGRLEASWAADEDEVREAQQLRWRVFADEMGARLNVLAGSPPAHDVDRFDKHCRHLLVRAPGADGEHGPVIATCRVLTPLAARRAGGLYSEGEFDLGCLDVLRPRMAEMGRSCVDPAHRSGGAILAMWSALAELMVSGGLESLVGCASVGMSDGGHSAASLWAQLSATHLAEPQWQVAPWLPLPIERLQRNLRVDAPPLIKGYLRCGAKVLGPPAWDPDFNSADFPMLICIADLPQRYRDRFMSP